MGNCSGYPPSILVITHPHFQTPNFRVKIKEINFYSHTNVKKLELVNIRQVFKSLQAKNVMSGYLFIFLPHNTVETDVVTLN